MHRPEFTGISGGEAICPSSDRRNHDFVVARILGTPPYLMSISSVEAAPVAADASARQPSAPDFVRRRKRLMEAAIAGFPTADAVLVNHPKDIHYLTGAKEGVSWLILSTDRTIAISRHLMIHEVREIAAGCDVILPCERSTQRPELERFIAERLRSHGLGIAVFEPARIDAASYLELAKHLAPLGIQLQAATAMIESLRSIKDDSEQFLIRRSVEIAEEAFLQLISGGARGLVGRSERDVAIELERLMISLGADRQGFPETGIIVASGPNSANAHHTPSRRRIVEGEALLIDWGAELGSYRSDMTRTLFPGHAPEFARQAYPAVLAAMEAAAALLGEGRSAGEVDRAARESIVGAGFDEFHYGVGHGVGLEIHEGPWLRANSDELLMHGMVTTIEPGIYLPGKGGIRIENLYRILPGGSESLCRLPVDFESMILS
jgi:Xaa-Pro aminopeptidase